MGKINHLNQRTLVSVKFISIYWFKHNEGFNGSTNCGLGKCIDDLESQSDFSPLFPQISRWNRLGSGFASCEWLMAIITHTLLDIENVHIVDSSRDGLNSFGISVQINQMNLIK